GYDACEALPVSERIYPTKVDCETMANRIHKVRPNVVLLCGSACGYDACEALPVSERIYPTKVDCETMANRIHKVRPNVVL
ncbi:hypothetical protein HZD82_24400, partial [Pantoea agglomerans]|uniref:hypothetical protein n=1 Tax=Enterobacter agglomerans TaxID=549 RepID=UPI001A8E90C1